MKIEGMGTDIVEVERLEGKHDLLEKVLTPNEMEYCRLGQDFIQRCAGRFAAKEAVFKAVNKVLGSPKWHDVEIISDRSSPSLSSECELQKKLTGMGKKLSISISHEKKYAVANALLWSDK